jgi:hypothetical protein
LALLAVYSHICKISGQAQLVIRRYCLWGLKKYEITKNINVSNNVDKMLISTHRKQKVTSTEFVKKMGTDQQVLCWNFREIYGAIGTE